MKKVDLRDTKHLRGSFKLLFSIEDLEPILSLSRSQIYRVLDKGFLESIWLGRSRRVTLDQLNRFIDYLETSRRLKVRR